MSAFSVQPAIVPEVPPLMIAKGIVQRRLIPLSPLQRTISIQEIILRTMLEQINLFRAARILLK